MGSFSPPSTGEDAPRRCGVGQTRLPHTRLSRRVLGRMRHANRPSTAARGHGWAVFRCRWRRRILAALPGPPRAAGVVEDHGANESAALPTCRSSSTSCAHRAADGPRGSTPGRRSSTRPTARAGTPRIAAEARTQRAYARAITHALGPKISRSGIDAPRRPHLCRCSSGGTGRATARRWRRTPRASCRAAHCLPG